MPAMTPQSLHPSTIAIHGGQAPEPVTGAVMPPIVLSSTYAQPAPGEDTGFDYSRGTNPSRYAFERCIALLEGSTLTREQDTTHGGFAFASGLASITAACQLLHQGDHVIAMDDLYGGTGRLFRQILENTQGLSFSFVDMTNPRNIEQAITEKTRLIWLETPTNPLLKIADLAAIAAIGRERNILTGCDNTFASPMLQRPLDHGIDIAMHSVTKYLGGHSDVIGGVLVTKNSQLAERIRFLQYAAGAVMGPFDSYLALRGLKTLALRMQRHCASALKIASWLEAHPKIDRVIYPGLPSHPQHDLAQKQMQFTGDISGGGGMLTIFIKGGEAESRKFLEKVHLFTLAESLGGVESLIEHPALMTHISVPPEVRKELGISDNLIRLSVGIEHPEDLIADLDQALAVI